MSLIFRKALRYVATFVRRESKPVNHSVLPLKTVGSSCDSLAGSSSKVHTISASKQTLQKLVSNPYKEFPNLTYTSTGYLKEKGSSLYSAVISSGIGVKDEQTIQDSKPLKSVQNGNKFLKTITAVETHQASRCFGTSTSKTTQFLKKDASFLGYFHGTPSSTTECNQISRCYSSYNCKKKRRKDPCEKIPPRKPPNFGCLLIGPSGVYPTLDGGFKVWRNVACFICIPSVVVLAFTVLTGFEEPERPEFRKYEYMRKRSKKFPWCGGTDRTFFHNPHLNALPDGYEEDAD